MFTAAVGLLVSALLVLILTLYAEASLGDAVVAIGTLALAAATGWLGWQTRELGARTVEIAEKAEARRAHELLVALDAELGENVELLRLGTPRSMGREAWIAARGLTLPPVVSTAVILAYAEIAKLTAVFREGGTILVDPNPTIPFLVTARHVLRSHLRLEPPA
jgi:hypothetical protein